MTQALSGVPGLVEERTGHGETTVVVERERLVEAALWLRDEAGFNFLSDIAAADYLTGSATALAQRGIGKTGANALHTGDKITVKFLPARDGSPLGFLKTVVMPDGRVIQISAGNPND